MDTSTFSNLARNHKLEDLFCLSRNWAPRPRNWIRLPTEAEFFSLLYCVHTDCGAHPTTQCVPGLKESGRSVNHLPLHLLYSYRTRTVLFPPTHAPSWRRVLSRGFMLFVTLVSQILAATIMFLVQKGTCLGHFFYISDCGLDVTSLDHK
jgi:hypothetical protein